MQETEGRDYTTEAPAPGGPGTSPGPLTPGSHDSSSLSLRFPACKNGSARDASYWEFGETVHVNTGSVVPGAQRMCSKRALSG